MFAGSQIETWHFTCFSGSAISVYHGLYMESRRDANCRGFLLTKHSGWCNTSTWMFRKQNKSYNLHSDVTPYTSHAANKWSNALIEIQSSWLCWNTSALWIFVFKCVPFLHKKNMHINMFNSAIHECIPTGLTTKIRSTPPELRCIVSITLFYSTAFSWQILPVKDCNIYATPWVSHLLGY